MRKDPESSDQKDPVKYSSQGLGAQSNHLFHTREELDTLITESCLKSCLVLESDSVEHMRDHMVKPLLLYIDRLCGKEKKSVFTFKITTQIIK